jgi:glycine/D-amino acid oxidase-like deaminating enzyme
MKYSVVIIGGGIIGSSVAYFLVNSGSDMSIAVIEPDPTYEHATTPQGAGGVRQQFSIAENIAQSTYSLDFYKSWDTLFADVPNLPDLNFQEQGYLFVVGKDGVTTLKENEALQRSMGVSTQLLSQVELRRKFPSIGRQ